MYYWKVWFVAHCVSRVKTACVVLDMYIATGSSKTSFMRFMALMTVNCLTELLDCFMNFTKMFRAGSSP
jgi:hypothetical protein